MKRSARTKVERALRAAFDSGKALPFTVAVTFDVVSHASAEHGDVDDAGYLQDAEPVSLRDALSTLRQYGPYDGVNDSHNGIWFQEVDGITDYRSGDVTRRAVHIKGSPHDIARLLTFAKKARLV